MSDIGIYTALEAEIVAALQGISGVRTVSPAVDVPDLIYRHGINKPAIGVIHASSAQKEPLGLNTREFLARTTWHVGIAVESARGQAEARQACYVISEAIMDKLHFHQSSKSPFGKYLFQSLAYPEQQPMALFVAVAIYELEVQLGN